MKTCYILFLIAVLSTTAAKATTWTTVSAGFWINPSVWQGGIVPPASSSDTFLINHPIALQGDLNFTTGAYINIAAAGGICGHHNITVGNAVNFDKYGILELDSLFIPGGHVTCYAPGHVVLTCYGEISLGGTMTVSGCAMDVGPWFECKRPEYDFTAGIDELQSENAFFIAPNPNNGQFKIQFPAITNDLIVKVVDPTGRVVTVCELKKGGATAFLIEDITDPGIYIVSASDDFQLYWTEKVIVE